MECSVAADVRASCPTPEALTRSPEPAPKPALLYLCRKLRRKLCRNSSYSQQSPTKFATKFPTKDSNAFLERPDIWATRPDVGCYVEIRRLLLRYPGSPADGGRASG